VFQLIVRDYLVGRECARPLSLARDTEAMAFSPTAEVFWQLQRHGLRARQPRNTSLLDAEKCPTSAPLA
jgi:hypothetical protein